ncbi:unnamed protein product [Anisakis simplex]|uniref:Transmembrane GTPase fzo-1 (inferred by orthology to a C. elegans protein) n=1 Tax=Anisakis simplex TaxID=6269 RepID=A0A0M3JFL9_ANISI|nr:unnamed protein product [Anisakis simplex]
MDGHQYRAMEFTNFESQFEQIISKSAINTKFEAHQRRAREIVAAMRANIEIVNNVAAKKRESLEEELRSKEEIFKQCYSNWKEFERNAIVEVKRLRAEVHLKVSADFYEEIYRLEAIIDKFDYKFVDEPRFIKDYKKVLFLLLFVIVFYYCCCLFIVVVYCYSLSFYILLLLLCYYLE